MQQIPIDIVIRDQASRPLEQIDRELDRLDDQSRETSRGLDRAEDSMDDLGNTTSNTNQIMNTAIGVFAGLAASVAAVDLAGLVNQFAETDDFLRRTQAVARATEEQYESLRDTVRELGRTTENTSLEISQGAFNLSQAGQSIENITVLLPDVLRFAEAGILEIDRAAEIATGTLSTFGLGIGSTQQVLDVFINTAQSANTSVEQMAEAVRSGGISARQFGVDFELFASVLGVSANSFLRGSEAGTAFRSLMARLANPIGEAGRVLEEYGITQDQVNVSALGLTQVIENLAQANISAADQTRLFGEGASNLAGILLDNVDAIRDFEDANRSSNGVLNQTVDIMNLSLLEQFQLMRSGVTAAGESIIEQLLPAIRGALTLIIEFSQFVSENAGVITSFGVALSGIATGLIGLRVIRRILPLFGRFVGFFVTLARSVGTLSRANILGVIGSAAAIPAAIIGAVGAGIVFRGQLQESENVSVSNLGNAFEALYQAVNGVADGIAEALGFDGFTDIVSSGFELIVDLLTNTVIGIAQVADFIGTLINFFRSNENPEQRAAREARLEAAEIARAEAEARQSAVRQLRDTGGLVNAERLLFDTFEERFGTNLAESLADFQGTFDELQTIPEAITRIEALVEEQRGSLFTAFGRTPAFNRLEEAATAVTSTLTTMNDDLENFDQIISDTNRTIAEQEQIIEQNRGFSRFAPTYQIPDDLSDELQAFLQENGIIVTPGGEAQLDVFIDFLFGRTEFNDLQRRLQEAQEAVTARIQDSLGAGFERPPDFGLEGGTGGGGDITIEIPQVEREREIRNVQRELNEELEDRRRSIILSADAYERESRIKEYILDLDEQGIVLSEQAIEGLDNRIRSLQNLERTMEDIRDGIGSVIDVTTDFLGDVLRSDEQSWLDYGRAVVDGWIDGALERANERAANFADELLSRLFEDVGSSGSGFEGRLADSLGGGGSGDSFFSRLFGFQQGGSFIVGGAGGVDSTLVAFRATPRERVTVSRPDQDIGGSTSLTTVNNNTFNGYNAAQVQAAINRNTEAQARNTDIIQQRNRELRRRN